MKCYRNFFIGVIVVLILGSVFVFAGCTREDNGGGEIVDGSKSPMVTIKIKNGGSIKLELYPAIAPNTVNNFISLIEEGYYDGLIFHRVIPGFMIQGGCPQGTGYGGPGYSIKGEFTSNGFENDLSHTKGVVSMARGGHDFDSAGSQFFIMVNDNNAYLDGDYAAFGKVIDGMEVVEKIVSINRDGNDKPLVPQVMEKLTVDLQGYTPKEPIKIK